MNLGVVSHRGRGECRSPQHNLAEGHCLNAGEHERGKQSKWARRGPPRRRSPALLCGAGSHSASGDVRPPGTQIPGFQTCQVLRDPHRLPVDATSAIFSIPKLHPGHMTHTPQPQIRHRTPVNKLVQANLAPGQNRPVCSSLAAPPPHSLLPGRRSSSPTPTILIPLFQGLSQVLLPPVPHPDSPAWILLQ